MSAELNTQEEQPRVSKLLIELDLLDTYAAGHAHDGYETMMVNPRIVSALIDCAKAIHYYQHHCSGHEPSLSVFHLKVDQALRRLETRT
jgi:hypothetical protein